MWCSGQGKSHSLDFPVGQSCALARRSQWNLIPPHFPDGWRWYSALHPCIQVCPSCALSFERSIWHTCLRDGPHQSSGLSLPPPPPPPLSPPYRYRHRHRHRYRLRHRHRHRHRLRYRHRYRHRPIHHTNKWPYRARAVAGDSFVAVAKNGTCSRREGIICITMGYRGVMVVGWGISVFRAL